MHLVLEDFLYQSLPYIPSNRYSPSHRVRQVTLPVSGSVPSPLAGLHYDPTPWRCKHLGQPMSPATKSSSGEHNEDHEGGKWDATLAKWKLWNCMEWVGLKEVLSGSSGKLMEFLTNRYIIFQIEFFWIFQAYSLKSWTTNKGPCSLSTLLPFWISS